MTAHVIGDDSQDAFSCGVAVAPVTDWRYYGECPSDWNCSAEPEGQSKIKTLNERSLKIILWTIKTTSTKRCQYSMVPEKNVQFVRNKSC